jgi:hypothetical protein
MRWAMQYIRTRPIFGLFMLVFFAAPVAAREYSDPAGFSFTYPEGWVAIAKSDINYILQESLPPEIQNWVHKNKVNLNQVSMTLVRAGMDEFLENVMVEVMPEQILVNDATVRHFLDMLGKQYRSVGGTVADAKGRMGKLGTRDVVVVDFQVNLPILPFALKQRQISIPAGGNTYVVTCTAKADTFANYSEIFENILASFKVPAPFTRVRSAPAVDGMGALIGGIVGGVVAGVIVLLKKLTTRKKAKPIAESPPGGV